MQKLSPQNLTPGAPIGAHLRAWRAHRGRSQLDLSLDAEISQRHLSCVESGRASPSRDMVLRLAEHLRVPLRARNTLLMAAGYAPAFAERPLDAPEMAPARAAVQRILDLHAPHPALAMDRHWNLVLANAAMAPLLDGVTEPSLLAPPVNLLRLAMHPAGLAPRIANLAELRAHMFERLHAQLEASADPGLAALRQELAGYPAPPHKPPAIPSGAIAVPLELQTREGPISFLSTLTVFGSPSEITLSELAVEAFFPADPESAARLARLTPAP